jgi:hypothetical protein
MNRIDVFILSFTLALIIYTFITRWEMKRRVRKMKQEQDDRNTCWHCKSALVEDKAPPHCMDCAITDEDLQDWEDHLDERAKRL